jgi:dTMP kinase
MHGKFITLEGVDGAGKSTHVEWLADVLRTGGRRVAVTREPGGTELAEKLREMLLHSPMEPLTETLLMFAARDEHVRKRVLPDLQAGTWVVCDRFTESTLAYQGGGKGVATAIIDQLSAMVHPGLKPDLTLIFDCPYEISHARVTGSRRALDRFEREGRAFFERVRASYVAAARAEPQRIHLIDSTQSLEEIRSTILAVVAAMA